MTADFKTDLERFGPEGSRRTPPTIAEARAYCRQLARAHYENFPVVSWLLPRRLHQHFDTIYAYCRWADDLADEIGDPQRSLELLRWWKDGLDDCFRGSAAHPVFVALAETVQEFSIPREPFADLLSAFEQDQRVRAYDTHEQLLDYCRRSANPVGRLVLYLYREHSEQNVAWSDSICTGLQLANFWQDVRRDYDRGRLYIPREDRAQFGYSDEQLALRTSTPAFIELLKFEVEKTRRYLCDGLPLIRRLPLRLQIDIDLFARGGLAILDRIAEQGYRVWESRPVLTKFDFVLLLMRSLAAAVPRTLISLKREQSDRISSLTSASPGAVRR